MLSPYAIAIGSVAAGSVVAFLPGVAKRVLGPARTFALTAALAVVLGHLLPEALEALGAWALSGFVAGLLVPLAFERLAHGGSHNHHHDRQHHHGDEHAAPTQSLWHSLSARFTFLGLLLHQLTDGMGLSVYSDPSHESFDVAIVIGAHTIPLTMLVLLDPLERGHRRRAAMRALLLAGATSVGVYFGAHISAETLERFAPWTSSLASGLLLHILWHGIRDDLPHSNAGRSWDLLAAAAGAGLTMAGILVEPEHATGMHALRTAFADALVELSFETAPMLLLGLVVGAAVHALGGHVPARLFQGSGVVRLAVRGALLGAPLPVCACGVLPVARTLSGRGATASFVVAFLFATPELGFDTVALTAQFLGLPFAILRVALSVGVAILGGVIVGRLERAASREAHHHHEQVHDEHDKHHEHPHHAHAHVHDEPQATTDTKRLVAHFVDAFDELLFHTGPWVFVGLVGAAFVEATLPMGALSGLPFGVDVLVVTLLALPTYIYATAATPLAAVLVARGLTPGAALAGLVLGPVINVATFLFVRRNYGTKAAVLSMTAMIVATWIVAAFTNVALDVTPLVDVANAHRHGHGLVAVVASTVLGAALLRGIWRAGLRAWFASLGSLGHSDELTGSHACDNPGHHAH